MSLAAGERLGPYEIIALLGEGGMGEVYRARDTKLDRHVALKILPESFASDPDRMMRFEREAKTLASLNHPHIAQIHGFEQSAGASALVMELVEGEDLSQRIARGAIPMDEALPIARQIVAALEAAHEQGIVHRDLKPANIKVRADGTVKVLDFGLAKPGGPARVGGSGGSADISPTITTPAMTAAGIILGTAAYMSPEQAKGRPVDKRADIWAFGCVLFEMLTGRRAFAGDDVSETLATILKSEPDWSAVPPQTPPSIRRLLKRALAKPLSQRLADMTDARLELDDATDSAVPAVVPVSRRSRVAGVAWFAAGAAIAAAATFIAMPARPANRPTPIRFPVSYDGALRGFAVSPDGQSIVYAALAAAGRAGLFTRRMDAETATLLPGTEDAWRPFWSPDGQSIAFFSGRQLRRIEVTGRGLRTICETGPGPNVAARGSWGDAATIIYVKSSQAFSVPAGGGAPTGITISAPMGGRLADVRAFPGSQRLLMIARNLTGAAETWSVRPDGSDARKVADAFADFVSPDRLIVAGPDDISVQPIDVSTLEPRGPAQALGVGRVFDAAIGGDSLAIQSGSNQMATRLGWFDRTGKPLGVVGEVADHYMPRLSPDGTKLAVETHGVEGGGDLFVHDLKTGTRTRLTFEPTHHNASATWSPDGARIAFHSTRQRQSVFVKPVSGVTPETLALEADNASPVDWSPDGQFLFFDRMSRPSPGIYRLPMSGPARPEPVLVEPETRVFQAQLSPDGALMAYVSEGLARDVFVSPFPPTGAKWQVSTSGGHSPRWNRNGRELFYISADRALMSAPVNITGTFSSGTPVMLFQTAIKPLTADWFHYDVAPDGNRFIIVSMLETAGEPLHVIVNWQSLLPKN